MGFYSPITTFTRKQCETIQTPIYQSILPKMGYNRHIPLAVRYGPAKYGGMGLIHTYTEQALKHTQYLLGTIRQTTELADSMIISLSNIQLLAGIEVLFLNKPKKQMPYIQGNTRSMYLWQGCNQYDISLHIEQVWKPVLQREGDSTIMDMLLNRGLSNKGISIMNRCRVYLQVIFISDIVTADGQIVMKWATHPTKHTRKHSNLQWPHQTRPSDDE